MSLVYLDNEKLLIRTPQGTDITAPGQFKIYKNNRVKWHKIYKNLLEANLALAKIVMGRKLESEMFGSRVAQEDDFSKSLNIRAVKKKIET